MFIAIDLLPSSFMFSVFPLNHFLIPLQILHHVIFSRKLHEKNKFANDSLLLYFVVISEVTYPDVFFHVEMIE